MLTAQTSLPVWPENPYTAYSFIKPQFNSLQFYDRTLAEPLFAKLKNAKDHRVTILYIGDSHVQADGFTGELRSRFQQTYGNAGRGLVFPYSTARTHATVDYSTAHTGRWLNAKNIEAKPQFHLGVSGVTARTVDSDASFRITFKGSIQPDQKRIRIFLKKDAQSFDFTVKSGNSQVFVDVFNTDSTTNNNMVLVDLPSISNEITFTLKKSDTAQVMFEIYGISIETAEDKGVLFHSAGINGAGHYSLLRQDLMKEQLELIRPDAVVIDLGANDFYRGQLDTVTFSANLLKIINIIRSATPQVTLILSCSQDIYRGGYSLPDCMVFSDVVREFSKHHQCLFYDWYWVAGGRFSMKQWHQNALSSWDMVHLNHNGYLLKGKLMAESYEKTAAWLHNHENSRSLIYNIDSLKLTQIDTSKSNIAAPQTIIRNQWIYHRVLRGQTIWTVAARYGVSAYQIKKWNRIRSNYLRTGQVLKIYAPIKVPVPVPASTPTPAKPAISTQENTSDSTQTALQPIPPKSTPKPPVVQKTPAKKPQSSPVANRAVYHKIKSGESLFSIAKKYGTSTSAIMKLNNMKNHNIRAGKTIRVK